MASPSSPYWEGSGSVGYLGSISSSISSSSSSSSGGSSDGHGSRSGSLDRHGSLLSTAGDYNRFSWTCLSEIGEAPIYPSIHGEGFEDIIIDTRGATKSRERHVFLCFKEPLHWPSPGKPLFSSDRLPRVLTAAVNLRKDEMTMKTRLIICEGRDGTETSNGDVMIFPDMIRYRGLTHFDVDAFVDEVLIRHQEWLPGRPERLFGTHIFVYTQGNPSWSSIIQTTQKYIAQKDLGSSVCVKPCTYIDGQNKYAISLITYGLSSGGEVLGHCYGSVTPENIPNVLEDLHEKGYFLSSYRHPEMLESGFQQTIQKSLEHSQSVRKCAQRRCPGKARASDNDAHKLNNELAQRFYTSSRWHFWEKDDTLAAMVVMGAAASVAVASHLYWRHNWH